SFSNAHIERAIHASYKIVWLKRIVRVSPQYAQAFQTPTRVDAAPQPTIVAAPARLSLQAMHVAGFPAKRRLAPAALWAASSSRRIPVSCIVVKEFRAERPRGSQRGSPCRKTAILIVTIRRLLSPRSFTRPPISILCSLPSAVENSGEGRAYHVPHR